MTTLLTWADERLRANAEGQIARLTQELADLEDAELLAELEATDAEREELAEATREALERWRETLERWSSGGNAMLSTQLENAKWATRMAIKNAFQTPEILKLFARRDVESLRERCERLKEDERLLKVDVKGASKERTEILIALRKLGTKLSEEETQFLKKNLNDERMKEFEEFKE